jgi:hypothetical protein
MPHWSLKRKNPIFKYPIKYIIYKQVSQQLKFGMKFATYAFMEYDGPFSMKM